MRGRTYLCCPDCGRKSVYWKAQSYGEDAWLCRYRNSTTVRSCSFYAFTLSSYEDDIENLRRLWAANPESALLDAWDRSPDARSR